MQKSFTIIALAYVMNAIYAQGSGLKDATVIFRVVDECNIPVTNASFFACSLSNHKGEGYTDANGVFSYHARAIYDEMYCKVGKIGYYVTAGNVWNASKWGDVPTNTLAVVMKRIINPVPMVRRKVRLLFPVLGEPIGFDFAIGNWITPYGGGKTADVWITGIRNIRTTGTTDRQATMVTSNALDGFTPFPVVRNTDLIKSRSDLPPPHLAPTSDFTNSLSVYYRFVAGSGKSLESNIAEPREFIFRVRSQTNLSGEMAHANVGWFCFDESIKLVGAGISAAERLDNSKAVIVAEKEKKMWIAFEYYYNPNPLSRSLEPKEIADRQGQLFPIVAPHPTSNAVQSAKAVEKRVVTGEVADELSQQVRQFMLCMQEGDTNKYATLLADDFRTASGMNRERHLKGLSGRIAEMREHKVEWSDTRVDAVYATEKDNEFSVVVDVIMVRPGEKQEVRQTWTFRHQNNQWFLVLIDK